MTEVWRKNIRICRDIIQHNQGPEVVNVVSGSDADQLYWQERLIKTRPDIFRTDGETKIISTMEKSRKGNFLGSINAWIEIKRTLQGQPLPPMTLMTMVFGMGKRLSPFTQALVNRKPAFPTPMRGTSQQLYLSTADVAAMSASLWQQHLAANGFRGLVIKWGDEAVMPGKIWEVATNKYKNVDGIRFIWQTEPTQDLAREKEWVEFDEQTSQMTFQYTRQGLESLRHRLSQRGQNRCIGVNLGSLGISYDLMEVAEEVFRADVMDETRWVDWDPYTWIALSCQEEEEWNAERGLEERMGRTGIRELEQRIPDFYSKIRQVQNKFRERYGRLPVIRVLDFGQPYWMDWGLHLSLRKSLEALLEESELGEASRELFHLPHDRDKKGNILIRSIVPAKADIRDSLLVDTTITDPGSVIHGGMVVAGKHRLLQMPFGGSVLLCAADVMSLDGPHAIAFKATGNSFQLGEGERLTHLYLSDGIVEMRTNESQVNYEGENYSLPILGNPISFEEAARRMSVEDTRLVENRWSDRWNSFVG